MEPGNARPIRVKPAYSPSASRDRDGKVWLLTAYAKAATDNVSAATLVKLRKELIDD